MKTFSQKFRVAIVGAGVCGLYLAWKLSKSGQKVTVFEKNPKILPKPCSGLISERLKNFIPLTPLDSKHLTGRGNSLIENKITSCLIHFPRKTITLNLKPTHFVIDRQKLNEQLLKITQESGVEILFNQNIKEIPEHFDRIIGCDGALSKIRELLKLPRPAFRLGLQIFQNKEDSSNRVEVWPQKKGFFWRIPRGQQIEYGAILAQESAKKNFEEFCENQKISFDSQELKSALIPQGLILPKEKNITLCGDAVGLTKPWSGGGVIWGLTAAEILLKNFPDFEKYQRTVKKFFEPKIFKGKLITSLTYFLGNNFPYILPSKITRDNDFPIA